MTVLSLDRAEHGPSANGALLLENGRLVGDGGAMVKPNPPVNVNEGNFA